MTQSTPDQIENANVILDQFKQDGYVLMEALFTADEIVEINQNIQRVFAEVLPSMPSELIYYEDPEDKSTLKQLQYFHEYDDYFHKLFTEGRVRKLAECLLEGEVVPKNIQWFNKPPKVGQPTPPHQDGFYFKLNPCEAITMWLALEPVDEENGCVRYIPGSHMEGMRAHNDTNLIGFSQGIIDYGDGDRREEIAFPAQPGTLLAHHALTIHRADGNSSPTRTRQALGFIFYAARAIEDKAAHEAYLKKLKEKLQSEGKIE
ncbi:phytanoyl-CoA dioxygenase family protein [Poriferisphaera sp. WC338]|uniref:phytanoyl-CoA dioxygenase family protein n=1 Tax=Poriferisphaera sp. WC338 TaxID=3425129 RepID=UPI003D81B4AC